MFSSLPLLQNHIQWNKSSNFQPPVNFTGRGKKKSKHIAAFKFYELFLSGL